MEILIIRNVKITLYRCDVASYNNDSTVDGSCI